MKGALFAEFQTVSISELTEGGHQAVYTAASALASVACQRRRNDTGHCRRGVMNPLSGNFEERGGRSSRPSVRCPRKDEAAVSSD
jgi:hypothetical protein